MPLADALAQVSVEDDTAAELVQWASEQLLAGQELPAVSAELTAQGWPDADVEAAVEAARVQTRRERGILTRDDVAGTLESRYRRQTSGMSAFYRSGGGPLGIVAFAMGLRQALSAVRHLSAIARRNRRNRA